MPEQEPDDGPRLSARDELDLELIARQGRTLGEKPWCDTTPDQQASEGGA